MHKRGAIIALMFAGGIACAAAQWLNYQDPRIPRTKDGKPNLLAPAPRAANGKPDLSGIWLTDKTPRPEMERLFAGFGAFAVPGDDPLQFNKYFLNIMSGFKPEDDPIRPEFAPILKQRARAARDTPTTLCLPIGIPWINGLPAPYKLVQTPGLTLMVYEGEPTRQIFTDGRKHPSSPDPSWLGYAVGNWEKDTFVIDTVGFNDRTWLDAFGHPHSESLHVLERFHRRDFGHMDLQVTFEDPKTYMKAVTVKYTQTLLPDTDLLESSVPKTRGPALTCRIRAGADEGASRRDAGSRAGGPPCTRKARLLNNRGNAQVDPQPTFSRASAGPGVVIQVSRQASYIRR